MPSLAAVLYGLVASVGVALAGVFEEGNLPVYLINTESLSSAGKLFEAAAAPALFSHFLGDGSEQLLAEQEAILRQFPSRLLDTSGAAILVVENFDLNKSEDVLGSPNFYLEAGATDRQKFTPLSVSNLDVALKAGESAFRINAVQGSNDYNRAILETVRSMHGTKVMVVGLLKKSGTNERLVDASRHHKKSTDKSYIQIPSAFDSEDSCIDGTNSCSSKGACVKSSSGKWYCQCGSTKVGDYTYYWGGSDCSKRDVSFQFFLLVGTTLAIVVAAVLSVTLLFNLGKENGVPDTVKL